MKSNERYFLEVAKTLNITKAAERLFISQQDLSRHIQRLEKDLNVPLFYRKPHFMLTPYGDALRKNLERIQLIEQSFAREIQEIQDGTVGTIRFGIHFTRARMILPAVFPRYSKLFPHVNISIIYGETYPLQQMILQGDIDVIFSVNAIIPPEIIEHYVTSEDIFLLIPDQLMEQYFGKNAENVKKQSLQNGANIEQFKNIPFIGTKATSMAQIINEFLAERGINLYMPLISTDHLGNILLAAEGTYACFCPQMLLQVAQDINAGKKPGNRLNAFRINGISSFLRLSFLSSKNTFFPRYMQVFMQVAIEETLKASSKYKLGIPPAPMC